MARPPRAILLAGTVLLAIPGCQRDADTPTAVTPRRETARALADALVEEPNPTTLLAALDQTHREVREHLGPHRLRYAGEFALDPVEDPGRPKVGEPVLEGRQVKDALTLEFASASGEPLAFRLEQHSDHDDAREVVVIDERIYTHLKHRTWFWREIDSELHEQWLDDAVACMHDAVAFAAPQLSIEVSDGEPEGGRETLRVKLSRADAADPELVRSDGVTGTGAEWRHGTEIESVSGQIVLDRESGAWLSGEVEVGYALADRLGRKLRGRVRVEGRLEPVEAGELQISAPEGVAPLPERERYELERAKLLDGLAAP